LSREKRRESVIPVLGKNRVQRIGKKRLYAFDRERIRPARQHGGQGRKGVGSGSDGGEMVRKRRVGRKLRYAAWPTVVVGQGGKEVVG